MNGYSMIIDWNLFDFSYDRQTGESQFSPN